MVAEELGLNYEDVVVHKSDTSGTLFDVPTHASRGTYGAGLAVYKASQKVKQVLLAWASEILETPVENLIAEKGKIFMATTPEHWVSIKEVVETAQRSGWGSAAGEVSNRPNAYPPHF
jgi:CO/xanthine dehydrogenase Mo-binding subunit